MSQIFEAKMLFICEIPHAAKSNTLESLNGHFLSDKTTTSRNISMDSNELPIKQYFRLDWPDFKRDAKFILKGRIEKYIVQY